MATHSSILAWGVLWVEEPDGLQSMKPQRVGHDRTHTYTSSKQPGLAICIPRWRRSLKTLICSLVGCYLEAQVITELARRMWSGSRGSLVGWTLQQWNPVLSLVDTVRTKMNPWTLCWCPENSYFCWDLSTVKMGPRTNFTRGIRTENFTRDLNMFLLISILFYVIEVNSIYSYAKTNKKIFHRLYSNYFSHSLFFKSHILTKALNS